MSHRTVELIKAVFAKITGKQLSLLFALALVLIVFFPSYAIYQGGTVDLKQMKFSGSKDKDIRIQQLGEENETLRASLEGYPSRDEWEGCDADQRAYHALIYSLPRSERRPIDGVLAAGLRCEHERDLLLYDPEYRFYLLSRSMKHLGVTYISTREPVTSAVQKTAYERVQRLLNGVGCYDGPVNGRQETTRSAVIRFQMAHNDLMESGSSLTLPARLDQNGAVGRKTIDALLRAYEAQESEYCLRASLA